MITNDNKGTYLVKNWPNHDNMIYERSPMKLGPGKNYLALFILKGKNWRRIPPESYNMF